jgi:hypothetical protein
MKLLSHACATPRCSKTKPTKGYEMDDFEKAELAFDILEYAEVVDPVGESVLIKVNKKMWNKFMGIGDSEDE